MYDGLYETFLFENEAGNALTLNDEPYRKIIIQWFLPQLEEIVLENMWLEQNGATYHTDSETGTVL